jgi:type IV secretion system protein VirB5
MSALAGQLVERLQGFVQKGRELQDGPEQDEDQTLLRERVVDIEGYETYVSQAYNWRLIAVIEAVVLILIIVFLVYVAGQNRFIPYVISIGENGSTFTVHPAQRASTISDSVVMAQIKQFIIRARSVVSDPVIENFNINDGVYTMASGEARAYIDDWYKTEDHQPFARMDKGTVDVQISSVVRSGDDYVVTWTETSRSKQGSLGTVETWEATAGITFRPPENEPLRTNPLGLYITTLNWTKKL